MRNIKFKVAQFENFSYIGIPNFRKYKMKKTKNETPKINAIMTTAGIFIDGEDYYVFDGEFFIGLIEGIVPQLDTDGKVVEYKISTNTGYVIIPSKDVHGIFYKTV